MNCLIIAAGKGSRLWRRGDPKPLVPVLGVALIERVIRAAHAAGAQRFFVVSGYQGEPLRRFLDALAERFGVPITHLVNDAWDKGNGLSALKARSHLDGRFLLLMADHLFDPAIVRGLAARTPRDGEITLAVDKNVTNPLVDLEDVTRVHCRNGKVLDIGKGLRTFDAYDTGIFLCTPALFDALERSSREKGDATLSDGIRRLAAEGRVNAFDVSGRFWLDVDDPRALERAERALLAQVAAKANDGPIARRLNRPLSVRLTRHLARLPVTPIQVTFASFACSLLGAGLMAAGGYPLLAAGGACAQLASVIDGCDGELARIKFRESAFGGWLDAVLDRYADALLLFALTWHAQAAAGVVAFAVGFLAIVGSFALSYTADKYDRLMHARLAAGRALRIGRDLRVFMIFVGALINQPLATLAAIAGLMNGETLRRIWICRDRRR